MEIDFFVIVNKRIVEIIVRLWRRIYGTLNSIINKKIILRKSPNPNNNKIVTINNNSKIQSFANTKIHIAQLVQRFPNAWKHKFW